MIKRVIYFISLLLVPIIFCTCIHEVVLTGFNFNEHAFNEAKQKWKDIDLKNYHFDYTFLFGRVFYGKVIKGEVTVTNGIPNEDSVSIHGVTPSHPRFNQDLEELETNYKITSATFITIDDVFRLIEERVEMAKNKCHSENQCAYEMTVKYDEDGIPIDIVDRYVINGKEVPDDRVEVKVTRWKNY